LQDKKTQKAFFIGLLLLVSIAFLWLLADFFQAIAWAAIVGIMFQPVQRFFERRLRGWASVAAVLTVILIFFTVLLPTLLVASAVVTEAATIYDMIQSGELDPGTLLRWLEERSPQLTERAQSIGIDVEKWPERLSAIAIKGSQFMGQLALMAGQNVANFLVMFFLVLYLLFFVLRDGNQMLDSIVLALPLGDERERALFSKFAEVARATIKGTLIIGLVQGSLGGIMFAILGVPGAVFWGVVMVILSVLPLIGGSLVWMTVAIFLFASGAWIKALVLTAFGVLVIGLVDNLLRPALVGRDTKMPDYIILLSTLGGLSLFGISGFVIGPIIASLFLTVWVMFQEEFAV
jgi:predicted PurR-regulated permease PerM